MGLRRSRKGFDSRVQVNVTPFLDFAFQLLAFFVVMGSNPVYPEGEMDLALPTEKPIINKDQSSVNLLNIGEVDKAEQKEPEVIVRIDTFTDVGKIGKIKGVFLNYPRTDKDKFNAVVAQAWDADNLKPLMKELEDQLKQKREELDNKKDFTLEADPKLKWENIVKVRDACEKAGFSKSSFARKK